MELSVELFHATLHRIKGDGGTGGAERRKAPRVGIRSRVKLLPVKDGVMGTPVEVWTRDISQYGIGVMSSKAMKAGTNFILTLPSTENEGRVVLYCTVRNCVSLVQGIYAIGLSFEELHGTDRHDISRHEAEKHARETKSAEPSPVGVGSHNRSAA